MCSHIPLKERARIRKVMLQEWRHKNGSTVFMLTSAKTKRDPFCDQKSMVTWQQQSTNSSTKDVNLGTITDTLSWYKFSPLGGIRVKPKLHRRRRRIYESSDSRRRGQKLFIRTIYSNLASIVKNYHGIIEQLHFIDQKQAELQNELHVEQKKRHQQYYCNLDRMISGGWILWNAIAICKMTKTSWQTGNLKVNEDVVNPSGTCFVRGRNLGRRYSDCWDWRIGKVRCIRNISQKTECERSLDNPKRWRIFFLWQMVQQNYQEETTNFKNPLRDRNLP